MRRQGSACPAGVAVLMLGAALLASASSAIAQCPFDNSAGSLSSIDIRHNGALLSRSGQLFLPEAPVEFSVNPPATGAPHFALPATLMHPDNFMLLNAINGAAIPAPAFNTCTSDNDNIQYFKIPGDTVMLRTPQAAPQPVNLTFLAYSQTDTDVFTTPMETLLYECGCPTADCTACERCATATCPVAQELANQTCKDTVIPDSVCTPTPERAAMLDLRQSSSQLMALWSTTDHHCDWDGVECDGAQSVTGVNASTSGSTNLTVPPSFAALQNLAFLNLANTGLSAFPAVLLQLPKLDQLLLQHNDLGPALVPDFVWSLPVETLNLANTSLHGNLTTTGDSPTLPTAMTMVDLSDNMLMGPPPLASDDDHTLQLTVRQREGFFFDCTSNGMLDLGDSVSLDIDPSNCTVCGAAYALANSNTAAAVAADSLPPAPALTPGGEVTYMCSDGFLTSAASSTFNIVCQQAADNSNNTLYECPGSDPSECQCIEVVDVELLRNFIITGVSATDFTSNVDLFLGAAADAVGVPRSSVEVLVPARDGPGNGTETVVALTITTSTVSGFDTKPLTDVQSALDMIATNTTFIARVRAAAAAFASVSAITVSQYMSTTTTTTANSTAPVVTTRAPSSGSSGAPVAAIAGAAGGAAFLLVLLAVVCLCRRRKRNKTADKSENGGGSGGLETSSTATPSTPLDSKHSRQVVNPVFDDGLQASTNDYDLDINGSGGQKKTDERRPLNSKRRMVLGNTMGASSDTGAHVLQFDGVAGAEAETDDATQKHSKLRPESVMEKVAGFEGFDIGETEDGDLFDLEDGETFNLDDGGFGTQDDVDVDEFEEDTTATATTISSSSSSSNDAAAEKAEAAQEAGAGETVTGSIANSPFSSGGLPSSANDDMSKPGDATEKEAKPGTEEEEQVAQSVTEQGEQAAGAMAPQDEETPALPQQTDARVEDIGQLNQEPQPQQPQPQPQPQPQLPKDEEEEAAPSPPLKSSIPPQPAPVQAPAKANAPPPPPLPVKTTPAKASTGASAAASVAESPYSSLPPRSRKPSASSPAQSRPESRGSIGSAAGLSRTTSGSSAGRMSVKRSEEARRAAREARINALKAAKEQEERQKQHKHPSQWSFNECVAWLRHHGFKEFVDVFYNNGFEGRQLVALQARSFSGVRSLSQDRIHALVDAITELKAVGYWEPPEIEDEDVDTLAPLEEEEEGEEETSGTPLTGKNDTSSSRAPPPPPPTSTLPASLASTAPPPPPTSSRPLPPRPPASLGAPPPPPLSTTAAPATAPGVPSTLGAPPPVPGADALDTSEAMEKARIEHILSQHLTREDARALLKHGQGDEGEYLFRASQSAPGAVVLSMCHDGQLHSFQIQREGPLYVTPNKLTFPTLIDLVKYFKVHDSVGLPCRLSHACAYYDNVMPKPVDATLFGFGDDVLYDDVQAPVPAEDEYEVLNPTQTQKAQFAAMRAFTQN